MQPIHSPFFYWGQTGRLGHQAEEKERLPVPSLQFRGGGPTGKQFTRNQRYKLYGSGSFYDVENDALESQPLKINSLTEEQGPAYNMLRTTLDGFANARPAEVAAKGTKNKQN